MGDILTADLLWRNALAVIPLAILVAVICRWSSCRPSTRHVLSPCHRGRDRR